MKYLKRFNESNLDATFFNDCKDILLELEDIGIKTNINSYLAYNEINPINMPIINDIIIDKKPILRETRVPITKRL